MLYCQQALIIELVFVLGTMLQIAISISRPHIPHVDRPGIWKVLFNQGWWRQVLGFFILFFFPLNRDSEISYLPFCELDCSFQWVWKKAVDMPIDFHEVWLSLDPRPLWWQPVMGCHSPVASAPLLGCMSAPLSVSGDPFWQFLWRFLVTQPFGQVTHSLYGAQLKQTPSWVLVQQSL